MSTNLPVLTDMTPRLVTTLGGNPNRVMQSFTRAPWDGTYFEAQVDDDASNNMRISRCDTTGKVLDYAVLQGAGHGSSITAEYADGKVWIWLWWTIDPVSGAQGSPVRWAYQGSSSGAYVLLQDAEPVTDVFDGQDRRWGQFAIDQATDRIATYARSGTGKTEYLALYSLADYKAGNPTALETAEIPRPDTNVSFQGFTTSDTRAYIARGGSGVADIPPTLYELDWSTGTITATLDVSGLALVAGGTASGGHNEAEGVCLWRSQAGTPELLFGIVTGPLQQREARVYRLAAPVDGSVSKTLLLDLERVTGKPMDNAVVAINYDRLVRHTTGGMTSKLALEPVKLAVTDRVQVFAADHESLTDDSYGFVMHVRATWDDPASPGRQVADTWTAQVSAADPDVVALSDVLVAAGTVPPGQIIGGRPGPPGPPSTVPGPQGASVESAAINDGDLVFTLTDDSTVNAGPLPAASVTDAAVADVIDKPATAAKLDDLYSPASLSQVTWQVSAHRPAPALQGVAWAGGYWFVTDNMHMLKKYSADMTTVIAQRDMAADAPGDGSSTHWTGPVAKDGQLWIALEQPAASPIIGVWNQSDLSFVAAHQVTGAANKTGGCLGWDHVNGEWLIGGYWGGGQPALSRVDATTYAFIAPIPIGCDHIQGVTVIGDRMIMSVENIDGGDTGDRVRGLYSANLDGTDTQLVHDYSHMTEMEGCCVGPGPNQISTSVLNAPSAFWVDTLDATLALRAYDKTLGVWVADDRIPAATLTTKGDQLVMGADGPTRQPAPLDGQGLVADSTTTTGWSSGNRATDPSFSKGNGKYATYPNCVATLDTTEYRSAPQSLKVGRAGASNNVAFVGWLPANFPQPTPKDYGRTLVLSLWIKVATGSAPVDMNLSDGLGGPYPASAKAQPTGEWTKLTVSYPIPTTGPTGQLATYLRTATQNDLVTAWVDDISITYVDDTAPASTLINKGDMLVKSATGLVRLPVPTDGYVLMADSTQPTGWKQVLVTVADNRATDPGFTTGNGKFAAYGNSTVTLDTAHFVSAPRSLKIARTSAGTDTGIAAWNVGNFPQPTAADYGRSWVVTLWARVEPGGAPVNVIISDATGGAYPTSNTCPASGEWTKLTVSYPIPSSGPPHALAAYVRTSTNATDLTTAWIDDVTVTVGPK